MWEKIARLILKNRITILIILASVTGFMGYQASQNLHLDYALAKLMPDDDPILQDYKRFKEIFGDDGGAFILAIETDSLKKLDHFEAWHKLGKAFQGIDVEVDSVVDGEKRKLSVNGVDSVFSIASIYELKTNDTIEKFEFVPLMEKMPSTQNELDTLFYNLDRLPFYRGLIYSGESLKDEVGGSTLMFVFLNGAVFNSDARGELVKQIHEKSVEFSTTHGNVRFSGLPYIRTVVQTRVKGELGMFVGLALAITTLILFLFFRDLKVVFTSLLVVGIAVCWSLGTIALFDFKVTALMGLMPPLIIVIGIPNCVFLINKYHSEYNIHGNKIRALSRVIRKIGNATFLTNVTTAMGFATFLFTYSEILIQFGVVASINIIGVFIISILIIPIVFSFLPPPAEKQTKHLQNKYVKWLVDQLVAIVSNRRSVVYVLVLLIIGVGIYGVTLVKTTGNLVDDIPEGDEIRSDLAYIQDNFNGVMPFEILINSQANGKITKIKNLKKIEKLQTLLNEYDVFSKSLSIVNAIKFVRQGFNGGDPSEYDLFTKDELPFLEPYIEGTGGDKDVLKAYLDTTKKITRVSVYVKDIGTLEMDSLIADLEPKANLIFNPNRKELDSLKMLIIGDSSASRDAAIVYFEDNYRKIVRRIDEEKDFREEVGRVIDESYFDVTLTGSSIFILKGTNYLVKNLFTSLFLAICIIALMMAILFNSTRMVLVSLLPNLIPLVVTGAVMGFTGIPIKPSTILVFSIAFGISVDDTIHYLAKYRQELKGKGWNIRESAINALKETGVSMIYTSVILFFGFGIFVFSDFEGTVALGMLVALTLIVAMFTNLVLLPSLPT